MPQNQRLQSLPAAEINQEAAITAETIEQYKQLLVVALRHTRPAGHCYCEAYASQRHYNAWDYRHVPSSMHSAPAGTFRPGLHKLGCSVLASCADVELQ